MDRLPIWTRREMKSELHLFAIPVKIAILMYGSFLKSFPDIYLEFSLSSRTKKGHKKTHVINYMRFVRPCMHPKPDRMGC